MAVDAVKLGYGSRSYIASVVGCRRDAEVGLVRKTGLTTTDHVIKKSSQTQRKAIDTFAEDLPIEFDSILPRWTTRPSQGLALDGGNEIIVFCWRSNESELPSGWVTNEKRLSHLSVAEVIYFEALRKLVR